MSLFLDLRKHGKLAEKRNPMYEKSKFGKFWMYFTDKVILYTRDKELKKVPLIIPDREMNIFMLVTSSGEKGMEYLGADSTKFCRGERVRVIDGKFKGAEGYICRIKKNSRLVVAIQGVCAVATSYIPQSFIQKI